MPKLNPAIAEIETPSGIAALPVDARGFYVPWFVAWIDDRPEFRAMDHRKLVRAIKERLCWVCGRPLGPLMTFAIGPMCGVNRTSSEPPSHTDCARYSVLACPFLSRPTMVRREAGMDALVALGATTAGEMIPRNPGVILLWTTRSYRVFGDGAGGQLVRMGEPESVSWWREGRDATRAEVVESVRTGLPALRTLALQQELAEGRLGALEALVAAARDFERWYPAAGDVER